MGIATAGSGLLGSITILTPVTQYNIKPCYFIGVGQFASGTSVEPKKTEKTAAGRLILTLPSDGRSFAAWPHLRVVARGCPHLVMVNAGIDRNGLKFLDQLHKALHGHFKHAPAKLRRGRGCVAAHTVA